MARGWIQNVNDLPLEDIEKTVGYFKEGAIRALKAGFDAIEIHAAHGYSISGFLSLLNKRKDEYGGSIDGRIRILTDIYEQVRVIVGPAGLQLSYGAAHPV